MKIRLPAIAGKLSNFPKLITIAAVRLSLMGMCSSLIAAPALENKPEGVFFDKYQPLRAPQTGQLLVKHGDRLAICGDSITEQKMYSRLIEDYVTMCAPELKVEVRQCGWGGERTSDFLARMTNDCLRFKPTIATTSYGMNDHEYRSYEPRIGDAYRSNALALVNAFKVNGVRVIQGSPGCVGKIPWWQKGYTTEDLNLNLCQLRNIGVEIATEQDLGFADVFWPMLTAGQAGKERYGTNYAIAGNDGVHPGWAGHVVMAYAYLKAMGFDGAIGTFTVDLRNSRLETSEGHRTVAVKNGVFEIQSFRYPFCAVEPDELAAEGYPAVGADDPKKEDSIRSGMTFVPFCRELNRLMLIVTNGQAAAYKVTWGGQSKTFTAEQLAQGINLAEEFVSNPFSVAFAKVDAAIAAKQKFETEEIKRLFRPEGKPSLEEVALQTEKVIDEAEKKHESLAVAVRKNFIPVNHTLEIVAQPQ